MDRCFTWLYNGRRHNYDVVYGYNMKYKENGVGKKAFNQYMKTLAGKLELTKEEDFIKFCDKILEHAGYFRNCYYCDHFVPDKEYCKLAKDKPPAHVVVNSCEKFCNHIPW